MDVDRVAAIHADFHLSALQWSHVLMDVDSTWEDLDFDTVSEGFNGATS